MENPVNVFLYVKIIDFILEPEKNCFVSASGKPLSPMANTTNSIIAEFGKVNSIVNPTPTSMRRTLEPIVQSKIAMKT